MLRRTRASASRWGRMMRHAWVTRRGAWPLRTVREMVRAGLSPAEDDAADAPRALPARRRVWQHAAGGPVAPAALPDMLSTINVLDVPAPGARLRPCPLPYAFRARSRIVWGSL